jgi:hypothetical protein
MWDLATLKQRYAVSEPQVPIKRLHSLIRRLLHQEGACIESS